MIAAVSRSNFDFEFSCILLLTRTSIVAQYVLWWVLFRILNNNYQFNNLRMSPGVYQKGPLRLAPEKHSSVALSGYSASAARHFPDAKATAPRTKAVALSTCNSSAMSSWRKL